MVSSRGDPEAIWWAERAQGVCAAQEVWLGMKMHNVGLYTYPVGHAYMFIFESCRVAIDDGRMIPFYLTFLFGEIVETGWARLGICEHDNRALTRHKTCEPRSSTRGGLGLIPFEPSWWFVCSENTTEPATGTKSLDMFCLVMGSKWSLV